MLVSLFLSFIKKRQCFHLVAALALLPALAIKQVALRARPGESLLSSSLVVGSSLRLFLVVLGELCVAHEGSREQHDASHHVGSILPETNLLGKLSHLSGRDLSREGSVSRSSEGRY